ncbi:MAG TPA: hypothetical protein VGR62_26045 [Candidatus Binatia bacterium]|jgi:hypothetical protein|nr:hypothetical protein [Candidatus Binatia bacterium]
MLGPNAGATAVRWRSWMRVVGVFLLGGVVGCYSTERPSTPNARVVVRAAKADYEPSIMLENGVYRMWWCGDGNIYYAESTSLDSGWHRTGSGNPNCPASSQCEIALPPRGTAGSFDRDDVCDPSVIKVGATYYMYYGANNYSNVASSFYYSTNVGLATSSDGITWSRVSTATDPLLQTTPAIGCPMTADPVHDCAYGLGQPSVFYDLEGDGRYYMLFMQSALKACTIDAQCDGSTGSCDVAAGYCRKGGNPPRLFSVRASDAAFRTNTEVWAETHWQSYTPRVPAVNASWAISQECCSDWQYLDALKMIVRTGAGVSLQFMSYPGFVTIRGYDFNPPPPAASEVFTTEGPGIVRRPDGHALTGVTGVTAFDLVRSVCDNGTNSCPCPTPGCVCQGCGQWDLAHVGVDFAELPGTGPFISSIGNLLLLD